jgi:hypothetical protein
VSSFSVMDLVVAAVEVFQSPARCVLSEEDVRAFLEVAVHEYSRVGVARCRNWSEADVRARLGDEVHWIHRVGCWSQDLARDS